MRITVVVSIALLTTASLSVAHWGPRNGTTFRPTGHGSSAAAKRLKVLVNSPAMGYSHMQFQARLADLLVEAGHTVDVYIAGWNPEDRRSVTQRARRVVWINATTATKFRELDLFTDPFNSGHIVFQMRRAEPYRNTTVQFCRDIVNHDTLIEDIAHEAYDVFISEMFDPCMFYVAEQVGIPTRLLSSAMPTPDLVARALGIPVPRSYIPSVFSSSADVPELGWMERLVNMLIDVYHPMVMREMTEQMRGMFKNKYGRDLGEFEDLLAKSAYCFVNVHDHLDHPRPVTRKMQYIGGIAVKKPAERHTQEVEGIMSKPSKGLILFSMGTLIDSTLMPAHVKEAFLKTFAHFPDYTFLWRIKVDGNDTSFSNLRNVYTIDWMDQTTILADPRTKLFITHCGQNSAMEAAYNGVPVLGVPLFADQHYNSALLTNRGMALHQDVRRADAAQLVGKVGALLTQARFARNARLLAAKLRDAPLEPAPRFVRLVEFAARHDGLPELDLYANRLGFLKLHNLDIYVPLGLLLLLAQVLVWKALVRCLTLFRLHPKSKLA